MKILRIILITSLIASSYVFAQEVEILLQQNLDKLLELVKEGKSKEQAANKKERKNLKLHVISKIKFLRLNKDELSKTRRIADQLEAEFKKNQEKLRIAEEAYLKQLGSLNELFGHMQSISTDSRVTFESSLTAAEFGKDREEFLKNLTKKMGESTQLPTISEIEKVWYEIMREMKATGEVSRFSATVINVDGTQTECDVVRVGVYNAVCGNKYLEYVPSKGQYQFLARQPAGRYTSSAGRLSGCRFFKWLCKFFCRSKRPFRRSFIS